MLRKSGLLLFTLLSSLSIHAEINGQYLDTSELSVGTGHACAITTGGVKCFGNAEDVTLKVPANIKTFSQIQAGNRFNCMMTDKSIRCWGEIPGQSKNDILIGPK